MSATVFPTGVTIYDPEKCWNGYTIFNATMHRAKDVGSMLINMNGNVMNQWKGFDGFPNKVLPGGYVMGSTGIRNPEHGFQDMLDLVQIDWDGNIVWSFKEYDHIEDPGEKKTWMARQHHDYQREGNPVGYYVPEMEPLTDKGNTLILCHKNLTNPKISDKVLVDDTFIEITWDGQIIWEWICSEHFDEMGFSEEANNIMARNPGLKPAGGGVGDWMHINSMSSLGPNKWFDQGDKRFHPDNIIWDGRQTNIIAITSRETGEIVWKVGPDYTATEALRQLGQIIGQHHAHMIPRGLPGEGNILVFDNGGWAGYGAPNPGSPTGFDNALRDYSRVLEFDPTTLKIVWQYTPKEAGYMIPFYASRFYSGFISSAQRLPNGNTLITEGAQCRIFEVTREHELAWEYISPYQNLTAMKSGAGTIIYRAYRLPYHWIPQIEKPQEKGIRRLDNNRFRVPGSIRKKPVKITRFKKAQKATYESQHCVISR
ncbi:MAG: aryl-sulfate sulfotransferase [Deltaproteobacteria bacterium]|nr:aryl-sulfate sulfotransferase [Deltaproteobacteria bacterium]